MEKMLTYEEWCETDYDEEYRTANPIRIAWNAARQGMMPIPEAVGFEDFMKVLGEINSIHELTIKQRKETWTAAQAALIASGRVIEVPPVEDWPTDATGKALGISVHFTWRSREEEIRRFTDDGICDLITYIPRPAPAWCPKEGEARWVKFRDGEKHFLTNDKLNESAIEWQAAARSLDEITWTRDQFRERGDVWEVS